MLQEYEPESIDQVNNIMETSFATTAYASKFTIHGFLRISLGGFSGLDIQFTFNAD